MKKTNYIKEVLLPATFFATTLLFASCDYNQKPDNTKDIAQEHNEVQFDDNKQLKDAQFLVNAAEINLEEIELAKLAQQIGRTAHVKELGKMMEDAHTKSQLELVVLARDKKITVPTSPTHDAQDAYKTLNEKSGTDFDKAYADRMVKEHEKAIAAFEDASTDVHDTDIKNWAIATLPHLRTHLNHAIDSQEKFEKM